MAVKIRLRRMGSRNAPFYRVIAQDSRYAPTGRFIETLGWYDPKQDGNNFSLNVDRVDYWLGNGAQPSDTAKSLIEKARSLPSETSVSGTVTEEEVPAAAEEASEQEADDAAEETLEEPAVEEENKKQAPAGEASSETAVAEEEVATDSSSEEAAEDKKA